MPLRLLVRNILYMLKKKITSAFTLIELILVVAFISILSVIAVARYSSVQESARSAEAYSVLAEIAAAESAYAVESASGSYTQTWSDLDRFDAEPVSDNFDFHLGNVGSGYVWAEGQVGTDRKSVV